MTRILLVALCVAVVLQFLGLPFTLLDAVAGFDNLATEEFALQAGPPDPFRTSPSDARMESDLSSAPFDFVRSIFHPPPSLR